MDFNLIVLVAVGVIGSSVVIALMRGRGQGDTRMEIDGRTFQFPRWVMSAITRLMTVQEDRATVEVGQWEVVVRRSEQRLRDIPRKNRAQRATVHEAVTEAQHEWEAARQRARVAYEDAGRRWLLSADGQQWLTSQGLRFP